MKFFVGFNKAISNDRLWHEKYFLIKEQIPTFITQKQAAKVIKEAFKLITSNEHVSILMVRFLLLENRLIF